MKNSVIIKSFQHGISLHLPQDDSMDEILEKIAIKFKESAAFFKDAKMVLSIDGRSLSDEEEKQVIDAIESNSEIKILCLIGKDAETENQILKALEQYQNIVTDKEAQNLGQFYKGSLKNGQVLETDSSIIILGDVNPGANVISKKDIIIIGGLYGNAYAGGNGESGHYIIALDISAECIKVDNHRYNPPKAPKWPIRPKYQPKIAHVVNDVLVVEPVSKDFSEKI